MRRTVSAPVVVGVDASNLRAGGGLTHLVELLRAAEPRSADVARVVVWGGSRSLDSLDDRPWLEKRNPTALNNGLLRRSGWQRFALARAARSAACSVLFVPGGTYAGGFRPVVTMSQNMLPFEAGELLRFGWSTTTLRLSALRFAQSKSIRSADGVVFLTRYAADGVARVTGPLEGISAVIPHGINPRFRSAPRVQRPIDTYSEAEPFRLLYVSIVNVYKHQWHVVDAVAALRRAGLPVALDLVGPAYAPALARLERTMGLADPAGEWVRYHGSVPYSDLHAMYARADVGVFASSCENLPIILLETMAAGLPIACAKRGPMPEVLGDAGVYFDPERPDDIARALRQLIQSPELRATKAAASFAAARRFTWERCAADTFAFLADVARRHQSPSRRE